MRRGRSTRSSSPRSSSRHPRGASRPDWAERVTFYAEDENHGFGRGSNLVLKALAAREDPPKYVFLLNPDAELTNETLKILWDFMAEHPRVGIAGARIEKPGGVPVTAAFRFPSLASEFSAALAFGPISRLFRKSDVPMGAHVPTGSVDWVAGAAFIARLDALTEIDFFDPDYFLYYEEVCMMHRATLAGWEIWHVAEALVTHVEGASTDVKSGRIERVRRPAYWYDSWQMYFVKNHSRGYALLCAMGWMTGAALNFVLSRVRGKTPAAALHFFGDFWAVGVRPLLGLKAHSYE